MGKLDGHSEGVSNTAVCAFCGLRVNIFRRCGTSDMAQQCDNKRFVNATNQLPEFYTSKSLRKVA